MKSGITLTLLLLVVAGLAGCSQQSLNNAKQDLNNDVSIANQKVTQVAAQAKPDLQSADYAARVTVALRANMNLPSTIHVNANVHGVVLTGSVTTHHQKALAGQIAHQTLQPGQTVQNDITIG